MDDYTDLCEGPKSFDELFFSVVILLLAIIIISVAGAVLMTVKESLEDLRQRVRIWFAERSKATAPLPPRARAVVPLEPMPSCPPLEDP
jgi:hypothetical protein